MSEIAPDSHEHVLSGRVILCFRDHIGSDDPDHTVRLCESDALGPWNTLTRAMPGISIASRWKSPSTAQIIELMDEALARDPSYRPGPMLSMFEVCCANSLDIDALCESLSGWSTVARAWVDPGPAEPPVAPNDDPRFPQQGYLDPAPRGINAEFAWTIIGGDGMGQGFVDLERGWTLDHEDLVAHNATIISGLNRDYHGHGTAVLGQVAAVDNSLGCVGITPALASVRVVSQWRSANNYHTAEAILDAAANMDFGQVLLLEAQTSHNGFKHVPVEVHDDTYEAIRLATALGIIVVEAAGNGGIDLDTFTNADGEAILNPASADFRDSGAIMVGAASSNAPHSRLHFSCHGGRIDCWGWGQHIETTGDGWIGTSTTTYTSRFGGTSGASPIIAGAALAVQGVAQATLDRRLSPAQIRELLTDPATSTPSKKPAVDRIGVMPDLRAILKGSNFNAGADIYSRDFVGDTGDYHAQASWASPDIILLPTTVADPMAAFGPRSGTENSNTESYEATGKHDNFIYIRALNRGKLDVAAPTAKIFWSPVSTFVTPDLWTFIGTVNLPTVPTGDLLTVGGPLTWPAEEIPAPGHYCFIAILDHVLDPGPDPTDFYNRENFSKFIRANNNVVWRNFNVVANNPPSGSNVVAQEFLLAGGFEQSRRMRLEATMRLPNGAKAWLCVPEHLLDYFEPVRSPYLSYGRQSGIVDLPLNAQGRTSFGNMDLPSKARLNLEVRVSIPEAARQCSYIGWVSQFEGDEELGRVTWRFTCAAELEKRDDRLSKISGVQPHKHPRR